jgi:simple sugar transport system ATP-binding protein
LLLDEPTAGIDVHARAQIHNVLRHLARAGTTVVVVCSDPEELELLCDRVVVLIEGRLKRELRRPFIGEEVVRACYEA